MRNVRERKLHIAVRLLLLAAAFAALFFMNRRYGLIAHADESDSISDDAAYAAGNVVVRCYSPDGTELNGAVFRIERDGWSATVSSGQTLEEAAAGAAAGIVPGDYTMKQTKAPQGYSELYDTARFTVSDNGTVRQTDDWVNPEWDTTNSIYFVNSPLQGAYRIKLVSSEENDKPLEGGEFTLYYTTPHSPQDIPVRADGLGGSYYELRKYTTGDDGIITILDLSWDTYYLVETKAPAGYTIDERNVYSFVVDQYHNLPDSNGDGAEFPEEHLINNNKMEASISLTDARVEFSQDSYEYCGVEIYPKVTVTLSDNKLRKDRDYEIVYSNNVNVGKADFKITGKGNYTGEITGNFTIVAASIDNTRVTLSPESCEYSGTPNTPEPTVMFGDKALVKGTDYDCTYERNVDVGSKYTLTTPSAISVVNSPTVKITGKGNYTGERYETFAITPKSLKDAVVTLDQLVYEYTGREIKPVASVTVGGRKLTEGTDYTLSYKNNTSIASELDTKAPPSVIITGKGNYTGEKTETFTIAMAAVTDITAKNEKKEYFYKITFDKVSYVYSGDECRPSPKVVFTLDKTELKKDTDYTVSYANNKNAGSKSTTSTYPTVTITGKGIYSGKRTFAFTISPKSIASASVTLSNGKSVNYTGSEITNSVSKVELNGVTLSEGTDYEIDSSSVKSAQTAGTYQIKINGKGNYNNSVIVKWTINRPSSTASSSTRTTSSSTQPSSSSINYGRTSSSSTKPSGTTSSSSAKTTGSSTTASGNKTVSSSNARTETPAEEDFINSSEGEAVSDNSVSGNLFSDGDIKKETYNKGAARKHTYDGSKNGTIENLLTPAPGYENDGPIHAAVEDIQAVGEAILAGDFRDAVEDGSELEVWVDVQPAEDTVSDEERSLAEKYIMSITDKVAGLCIGRYLDVSVFFRIDKGTWEEADETRVPVAIDFSVPDSMQDQSDRYYVLCIHDGQVEFMSDINNDPQMITVMTQWLNATYVLLYQDVDAGVAGEIFGPKEVSLYTEHDSFDFGPKTEVKKKSHPKVLAVSWFASSILVMGGYGIWEALKDREAVKAMLKRLSASKSA